MAETKYVWDITAGKDFSNKEMDLVNTISVTLSRGGSVVDLKKAVKQLQF